MNSHHIHGTNDSHCDVCEQDVHARRPHPALRLAWYAAWPALVAMIGGAAMIGWAAIGVTVLAPFVMFTGAFLLGPLANMVYADPVCPSCNCPVRMFDTDATTEGATEVDQRTSRRAAAGGGASPRTAVVNA